MNKKSILLVDDSPDDQAFILMELRKDEVVDDIVVVGDGQQAVDYLFGPTPDGGRGPAKLPTAVFLDLKLPKLDGVEVLKRIRADERTKDLPVVMLTSSAEDRDRRECYGLGANSYVRKPVDFNEFAAAVRLLKLYWVLLNEEP